MSNLTFSFMPSLIHTHLTITHTSANSEMRTKTIRHGQLCSSWPPTGKICAEWLHRTKPQRQEAAFYWLHCAIWKCGTEVGNAQYIAAADFLLLMWLKWLYWQIQIQCSASCKFMQKNKNQCTNKISSHKIQYFFTILNIPNRTTNNLS